MSKILRRQKRAQGMTEYIIIVGLIAIFVIIAVKLFRNEVNGAFDGSRKALNEQVVSDINTAAGGGAN